MFELDSELKEISIYVDSSKDVAKQSVNGDSKECEGSGSNSDDGDNDSLSVPYLSRCIFVERYDLRTIIDEKELEGVTLLTSNEDSDDDRDLGGNLVGVRVGDDDSPRTSKDAAGTSSPKIFINKSQEEGEKVAEAATDEQGGAEKGKTVVEEADKADKEEVEQEAAGERKEEAWEETAAEAEEETTAACEVRKEDVEEKETEEAVADAHAEKEGEKGVEKFWCLPILVARSIQPPEGPR
ncbi:uncharacterized protein LOC124897308 [Capsicum annuum]|uniref:uncharacterized protein LOC124897308 n=1 Tax=Capsicum annuum TaxID=4072 RepID=UPI001FB06F9F|nr:uncharacterized protein LOC124897308 [Capsicum annuum]